MYLDGYCHNCGYRFPGRRTGKCPNCDGSAGIDHEKKYCLDPKNLKAFIEFDKKGGPLDYFTQIAKNHRVSCYQVDPKGHWIILRVLNNIVAFAFYNEGIKIIAESYNNESDNFDSLPNHIKKLAVDLATAHHIWH